MSLKAKLEAVIYAAEEPVTLAQLATLFAVEALELKAEQETASAAQFPEPTEGTAAAETLPLLPEGFVYMGLDDDTPVTLRPESDATEAVSDVPPPSDTAAAEEASPGESLEANPDSSRDPAAAELESRRLARLQDREVRTIIRQLLDELIASHASDERGVEIREIAGGYRMATKPECHDAVRSFVKSLKPAFKLSLPALETLAVIAYKQPVTAPEVNEIRGVDSSGVFGSLLARKLIATAGRKQVIGRPILYKTTREFLLRFGLKDVAELPSMEEFEKMAAIELDEPDPASNAEETASTPHDLTLDLDEAGFEDSPEDFLPDLPGTPEPTETAVTAASDEPPTPKEATPVAPHPTEQAETENSPHGEEDQ
jgi:segregation and condensation protein B